MAYRHFHAAYFGRLSRYLLVITKGNEDTVKEVLQETCRRVVRHVHSFDDEATFWSWLTVLARSALSDEGRKRRRYLAFLDRFALFSRASITPEPFESGDRVLSESLLRHIAALPEDERRLITSKYDNGETIRDIAAQLKVGEGAVESRLVRIRRKLKLAILRDIKNER